MDKLALLYERMKKLRESGIGGNRYSFQCTFITLFIGVTDVCESVVFWY